MIARSALATIAIGVALAGCGGGGSSTSPSTTTSTRPAPSERATETIDRAGDLPEGWTRYVDERGGFALGLPRGWKAKREGSGALIRSFDRLVAVSITPDRTLAAQQLPVDEFAARTATALHGFRAPVKTGRPHPYDHRYDGAQVRATGTEKSGVHERLRVIVLRRKDLVTLTAVIAANARRDSEPAEDLALKVIHTLRSRPPAGSSHGGGDHGRN